MTNYVNEQALFDWYEQVGDGRLDRTRLLDEVLRQYAKTRREAFVLPASATRTGQEERFPFRYENVGCCGASTVFIYF